MTRPPMKMLVDADWLRRKVESDPDTDAEAGSPPSPGWREAAARIIDPDGFAKLDSLVEERTAANQALLIREIMPLIGSALAKADALAALPAPGGWREIVAELEERADKLPYEVAAGVHLALDKLRPLFPEPPYSGGGKGE